MLLVRERRRYVCSFSRSSIRTLNGVLAARYWKSFTNLLEMPKICMLFSRAQPPTAGHEKIYAMPLGKFGQFSSTSPQKTPAVEVSK